ncbi:acyl-CoA N-acyltransferase [Lipomyces oligophaga]|uniref:acyl-CoA N-acyltransferase n=1 Tax=Lipomyces oligophaga TaxID=45792 RepID=UPI0034D00038
MAIVERPQVTQPSEEAPVPANRDLRLERLYTRDLVHVRAFLDRVLPVHYSASFLLHFITANDSHLLTVRDGCSGTILGVVAGRLSRSALDANAVTGHVMILAVDEHSRRLGIGTFLMRQLEFVFRSARSSLQALILQVESSNVPALTFYSSLGFHPERHLSGYYQQSGDGLLMRKSFSV